MIKRVGDTRNLHRAGGGGGGDRRRPAPARRPSEATNAPPRCAVFDIRIDRDGVWYYHGSPIGRKELVRLFASALHRDAAGAYWLITPAEKGRIMVEDAPFVAVELFASGDGRAQALSVRTNIDEIVAIDRDHPIHVTTDRETGEPSPYIHLRDGLDALIARPVYYELVALGAEERIDGRNVYGVWSHGIFFELGPLDR